MKNANLVEVFTFHITPETRSRIGNLPKTVNLSNILREFLDNYLERFHGQPKDASAPDTENIGVVSESMVKNKKKKAQETKKDGIEMVDE